MFDLIAIGDCVVDTFIDLIDAKVELVDGERKLLLPFGDKIPTKPAVSTVGGNAANAAVGASRLGLKSAIYTNIGSGGEDKDDDRIKNKLKKEGVDLRYVVENTDYPSTHHVVLCFRGERTILTYHQPWKYSLPDLDSSKWIYYTSLAPSFTQSNIVPQLIAYLERSGARLLYSPGTFQIKYGVKKYPRLLSLTELLITNMEEAKLILGHREGEKVAIKRLLKDLVDLGPRRVVITDGVEGSFGFDGGRPFHLKAFPAKVVQNTGAGDSFAAGTLAGLFFGKELPEAIRWGAVNAASVVERIGPQAGLMTRQEMLNKLKDYSHIVAKEI